MGLAYNAPPDSLFQGRGNARTGEWEIRGRKGRGDRGKGKER